MKRYILTGMALMAYTTLHAQSYTPTANDSLSTPAKEQMLQGATVSASSSLHRLSGVQNGLQISRKELFRAACCNLGESFVTNPSVDVSYTDAATGAQQIKLLGLSGTYVQMLTENIPDLRGAALPYALGYIPGNWMKSIQVSKGTASVKNGYEAITGQINVEYLKPEDPEAVDVNLYGNSKTRTEANIDANLHLNPQLSTVMLGHFENTFDEHDSNNDGFYDKPKVRQFNVMNRWLWKGDRYLFHGGASILRETRDGGQMEHGLYTPNAHLYKIGIETNRYEAYMKHGFVINAERGTSIALMTSASAHEQSAAYGHKLYYVNDKNAYASLIFETNFGKWHNLSTGLSLNYDHIDQQLTGADNLPRVGLERETVPGAYAQYTLNIDDKFTAMAGLRVDHSNLYGTFVTPRFHLKYAPSNVFALRLSAGKGYRTVHALAESNYLLASGRRLVVDPLKQEEAWNYGISLAFNLPVGEHILKLNAEYYYTHFGQQAVIDYDTDPTLIHIGNLVGKSYSHTMQVDATYPLFRGFTLTAAWRITNARTSYGGHLMERPLTGKYKGLLTAQYKTPLEKWQFDVTLQLNGGGRLPTPYTMADGTLSWNPRYGAFEQLSAQITREFPRFSLYIGGENLTNFKQAHPVIGADNPWSEHFEPTLVWGPVHGAVVYAGIRFRIERSK